MKELEKVELWLRVSVGASFESSESFVGEISEAKIYSDFFTKDQCEVAAMSGQHPSDDNASPIRPRVPWFWINTTRNCNTE